MKIVLLRDNGEKIFFPVRSFIPAVLVIEDQYIKPFFFFVIDDEAAFIHAVDLNAFLHQYISFSFLLLHFKENRFVLGFENTDGLMHTTFNRNGVEISKIKITFPDLRMIRLLVKVLRYCSRGFLKKFTVFKGLAGVLEHFIEL